MITKNQINRLQKTIIKIKNGEIQIKDKNRVLAYLENELKMQKAFTDAHKPKQTYILQRMCNSDRTGECVYYKIL